MPKPNNQKLTQIYDAMWQGTLPHLQTNTCQLDSQLCDANIAQINDDRRGITAAAYLQSADELCLATTEFLTDLKALEPQQYYYPIEDLHLTILSIISCYSGFKLNDININEYIDVFNQALHETKGLQIHFKGITASPSAILLQGFPENEQLLEIRNKLRQAFKGSILQQTIDQRYKIETAHATLVRFAKPLQSTEELLKKLTKYRNFHFGTFSLNTIELVFNDWYQTSTVTEQLTSIKLTGDN